MTLKEWHANGAYFFYQEHQLFYQRAGSGPVLLLLHGFPTASWDWCRLWLPLQARYTVLAIDMLGFGFSDKPIQNYTIHQQANIVNAFLADQNVTHYHLMAHDYGDTVAQELLARNNEVKDQDSQDLPKLLSLCLLNGGLFPETHKPLWVQKILMTPLGGLVSQLFTKRKLQQNFNQIFGPNTPPTVMDIDAFWELMNYNKGKRVFHLLIRYMQQRKQYRSRWVGALQQSLIPIRLINGAHDPISGRHMTHRYRELIPEPDVISLDGVGHYPHIELPVTVLQHFNGFISTLK